MTPLPPQASPWTPDQLHTFHERLGIADDLGMDTSAGSVAWVVAVRAAERAE